MICAVNIFEGKKDIVLQVREENSTQASGSLNEEATPTWVMASVFRTDRHLASPVLAGELKFVKEHANHPDNLKSEHRLLVRDHMEVVKSYDWMNFQADFIKHVEQYPPYRHTERRSLSRSLQIALKVHHLNTERCLATTVNCHNKVMKPYEIAT